MFVHYLCSCQCVPAIFFITLLSKNNPCPSSWKCIDATDGKLFSFCTRLSHFQHALLFLIYLWWDGNLHDYLVVSCHYAVFSGAHSTSNGSVKKKKNHNITRCFSLFSPLICLHLLCMLPHIWKHAAPIPLRMLFLHFIHFICTSILHLPPALLLPRTQTSSSSVVSAKTRTNHRMLSDTRSP